MGLRFSSTSSISSSKGVFPVRDGLLLSELILFLICEGLAFSHIIIPLSFSFLMFSSLSINPPPESIIRLVSLMFLIILLSTCLNLSQLFSLIAGEDYGIRLTAGACISHTPLSRNRLVQVFELADQGKEVL